MHDKCVKHFLTSVKLVKMSLSWFCNICPIIVLKIQAKFSKAGMLAISSNEVKRIEELTRFTMT